MRLLQGEMLPVLTEEQTLASVTYVCIITLYILSCCVCLITLLTKEKQFCTWRSFFPKLSRPRFQVFRGKGGCKTAGKEGTAEGSQVLLLPAFLGCSAGMKQAPSLPVSLCGLPALDPTPKPLGRKEVHSPKWHFGCVGLRGAARSK